MDTNETDDPVVTMSMMHEMSDTIASKVIYWLQSQTNFGTASASTPKSSGTSSAPIGCKLSKTLKLVLQDSLKGKAITNFYETNGFLQNSLRADLINVILDDIFFHNTCLSAKDFPLIIEEIHENFPNEMTEYYYIPRHKKKNPGGRLWDKYFNQKARRARSSIDLKENFETQASTSANPPGFNAEVDESILISVKDSLLRNSSDWDAVKEKWHRTFMLRQKELKTSTDTFDFLSNWHLNSFKKPNELLNIDFDLMHPNKSHLLFSKWNDFMKNIKKYYLSHVKHKNSKDILENSKDITNQDSLDYIYTVLLNSVILPTARVTDKSTNVSQKVSISDANESFIVHLTDNNDIKTNLKEMRGINLGVPPLIIVVGPSIYNLQHFYVYFNASFYKFDSFLQCLDVCFKMMQTLPLEYPKRCCGPWLFIQQYFYEISLANDRKTSSVCSLLNYFKALNQNVEC